MERPGTILFFGDTSTSVISALSQLLESERKDTLLSRFLTLSKNVLRDSVEHLPLHVRQDARRFTELYDFTDPQHGKSSSLRVLSPALLLIAQLGQFISWYETHPHADYPSPHSTVYIGLCVGQISASVISLSSNLLELIPLAVEAVRLALNLGSLVFTVRNDLEYDTDGASWALTVENKIIEKQLLDLSPEALGIPHRKQAYVSASFENTTTIQGPPTTLARLKQALINLKEVSSNLSGRPVAIYAPYHASHLYTEKDVLELMDSSCSIKYAYSTETWHKEQPEMLSTSSGSSIPVTSRRGLLNAVLEDILIKPIEWSNIIEGAISSVHSIGHTKWNTQCFGPLHSQKSLVAAISAGADVEILLADMSTHSTTSHSGEPLNTPIAIVGMAGRFPDADSVEELWRLLADGIDCHKVIPNDRFDPATHLSSDKGASMYGNFMKSPGMFDARFFNMSPREAMQTDPQQRLALVTAYEALEMAGYVPGRTPSTRLERVGSFYGQTTDDYKDVNIVQDIDTYYVSGVVRAFGPGRVSRANQLGGPCLSVDTACSSSATALNLACTSIWSNECDTAVVGGMMLLNSPDMYNGLARGHFTSDNGPCKTFDDEADGYCRGETVASVVLKRLDAAQADNDNILGVILAGGANYSAYAASITQPHAGAQETLFRKVLRQAAVHPFDIDYAELHGTGTQLGDSVEMTSVTNVLAPESPRRPADRPLYVGSLKANIGHGESASGISALIKALLLFQKENIPPHVGVQSGRLNRKFPALNERRVRIADDLVPFSVRAGRKRKILINNFGAAGTNSSLLLEEGSSVLEISKPIEREHLVSITAKSATSLIGNLRNVAAYLERNPQTSLLDLAYSTTARRVQHPLRVSIVASAIDQVKAQLGPIIERQDFGSSSKTPNLVFVFTGQGSLYHGIGKQFFEHNTLFRTELARFERIATEQGFPPFIGDVVNGTGKMNDISPVQTQICHVAIQMTLFKLWSSWNISPSTVIGHSLGEYAALYAAGVLSANDTLYLVGTRASLLESLCTSDTHAMLAVNLSAESVHSALQDQMKDLEISCFNSPRDVVLSGPGASIQDAERHLKANGITCTMLNVPYAFHSAQVEPILASYKAAARHITFCYPRIPVLSTLLGEEVTGSDHFTPGYFAFHARKPVNFVGALEAGQAKGIVRPESVFLELGPHPVCLGMIGVTLGSPERLLPTLRRKEEPFATTCKTLASLNNRGYEIDWNEYHNGFADHPRLLNLPTYAFDEKKYWIDYKGNWLLQRNADKNAHVDQPAKPLTTTVQRVLSTMEVESKQASAVFESDLADPALHSLIAGHVLNGVALCPSGVFSDIALTVANYFRERFEFDGPVSGMNVVDLHMMKPVTMPVERPNQPKLLRISGQADLRSGRVDIQVGMYNSQTDEVDNNATCHVEFGDAQVWLRTWNKHAYLVLERMSDLERGVARGITSRISHEMVYKLFSTVVDYDTKYHGMQEVIVDSEKLEAVVSLSLYKGSDAGTFFCSPLWLDNLAQIAGFVMNAIGTVNPREFTYISHGIDTYQIAEEIRPDLPYRAHVRMIPGDSGVFAGDVSVFQGDRMVASCGDVKFKRIPRALIDKILSSSSTSATNSKQSARIEPKAKNVDYLTSKNLSFKEEVNEPRMPDLKALIASQIGISTNELSDDSRFNELGVDSLLSMTILSQLQGSLEIQLPASLFTDFPTFGEMQDYVQSILRDQTTGAPTPGSASPGPATPPPLSEYKDESDRHSVDARLLEVYTIIADEIGVDVQEVRSTDDLSVLGLDSMMAISITAALETLGVHVPTDFFGDLSSTKDIHNALSVQFGAAPKPACSSPKIPQKTSKKSPSSLPFPPSIILQDAASAVQTLFLFPDGSGLATAYARIPPISPNTRVCGLNSPLLNSANSHLATIESLAAEMLRAVRARQPRGPYLLGGWSAGGMFAFEAARQVLEAGEQVAGLLLIDSPCRLVFDAMPREILDLIAGTGVMSAGVIENFERTIRAVKRYCPGPLGQGIPTTLIWAKDGLEKELDITSVDLDYDQKIVEWLVKRGGSLDTQGWDALIPAGSITIQTVPGSHFSMMQAPQTTNVGAAIAQSIQDWLG
ncbi:putative polyketide synthase [Aspergillus steynii IBT 23096]|uniref:Putative polyketide synthase n=1 Tax=Aspergillus steynii IBT 23096 TaxID=1392250 RepID=A0A2I2G768_9EURO|nr:putative polyketide synthase [Aspergillus steynii IBT 23096]PLB48723.1 putative polyketide synthase [Aspergillus steynii IBT 23096]